MRSLLLIRARTHYQHGQLQSVNAHLAADSFRQMDWVIVPYTDEQLPQDNAPDERN